MENKKKKKFKLFDMNRDGKGVYENEDRKPTLKFFFKLLWRKLSQILQLNLLMLFQIIPFIIIFLVYFIGDKTSTATNLLFAPLYGVNQSSLVSSTTPLLDMSSIQMPLPVFSPPVIIAIICIAVLVIATWGWQNVGATYVLRGLVRGDAVFVFSDFFYGIKKNLKQGFIMGIIDLIITAVLVIDFLFFYQQSGSFGLDFMYFMIFGLAILYIVMRFYLYHLIITFNIKTFKAFKNALIFTALGIKRNLMVVLGLVVVFGINIALIMILLPLGISLPLVLPLVYLMGLTGFITSYASYPIIDRYMIAPYASKEEEKEEFIYFKEQSNTDEASSDEE